MPGAPSGFLFLVRCASLPFPGPILVVVPAVVAFLIANGLLLLLLLLLLSMEVVGVAVVSCSLLAC